MFKTNYSGRSIIWGTPRPNAPHGYGPAVTAESTSVSLWEAARFTVCFFADDLLLLTSSEQGLQHALDGLSAACDQTGINISTKKTETICLSRKLSQCALQVSGITLLHMEKFNYFGVFFSFIV